MKKKQKRVGFVKQRSKTMKETSVHLHEPPQTKGKQQEGVQQTQQIYLKGNSKEISEKMPKNAQKMRKYNPKCTYSEGGKSQGVGRGQTEVQ